MQKVIISAYVSGNAIEENRERHARLKVDLSKRGYSVSAVAGSYEGQIEDSYMVSIRPHYPDVADLVSLGKAYGQDSILYINEYGQAWLYFPDARPALHLGAWTEIPEEEIHNYPAWTCARGQYYTTK